MPSFIEMASFAIKSNAAIDGLFETYCNHTKQNYLAVLFISNNSVHERYGTNLLNCEYLVWTDTYSAH